MSKRNLILLIILLFIFALVVYVSRPPKTEDQPTSAGGNFFSDFFSRLPSFGKNDNTEKPVNIGTDFVIDDNDYEFQEMLALRKVSSMPVAGFGLFEKEIYTKINPPVKNEAGEVVSESPKTTPTTEYQSTIRYVDKKNGHIYQNLSMKSDERKYSDITMPNIYEAFFGKNAGVVILRYLSPNSDTIETFVRELPEDKLGADVSTESKIKGAFLPQNITELIFSLDKSKILYLSPAQNGVLGILADANGSNKTQVFESPFSEWLLENPNKNLITMTTKPSSKVPGYMYSINPNLNDFNKIIGDINALTTLTSPNGAYVLFADDKLNLSMLDTDTFEIKNTGLNTLPEKCVWAESSNEFFCGVPQFIPFGEHPDDWYKGKISFTDNIWRFSLDANSATMLANPNTMVSEVLDLTRPALSQNNKSLFFIDKKNSFLWELRLK